VLLALATPVADVSQAAITEACLGGGNIGLLRRWARQGVRVTSWEPLCSAARDGLVHVVRLLVIGLGADVNKCDERGCTPLHIAAEKRRLTVLRFLGKELGADVNVRNVKCATILFLAAQNGFVDVALCLAKELGADVTQGNANCGNPVYAASLPCIQRFIMGTWAWCSA
jgi:hypothetical protein